MPPRNDDKRGVVAWLRRWWRALLAETLATALLVWLGVATVMPVRGASSVALTHPALAFGFVVIGNAMAFGPVSGAHMNPAVTLAALISGRVSVVLAVCYALAQMLGALIGFGALLAVTPVAAKLPPTGCTLPAPDVTSLAAAAIEAALTALLALACCGAWAAHDDERPDHTVPVKLGLVVAGLVYAGGHATGASLNPARSFAPALLQGVWTHHWVYWVGPLGGAALAALIHRAVLRPAPTPSPARRHDDGVDALPLNDKP